MYITITHFLGWILLTAGVSGALGGYCGHRGYVGVKNDLNDIKTDVSVVKAKVKKL